MRIDSHIEKKLRLHYGDLFHNFIKIDHGYHEIEIVWINLDKKITAKVKRNKISEFVKNTPIKEIEYLFESII